jgi:hypothetical protein
MVIAASREECGLISITLRQFETEHVPIKRNRAIEVRDLEMHVADADVAVDGFRM